MSQQCGHPNIQCVLNLRPTAEIVQVHNLMAAIGLIRKDPRYRNVSRCHLQASNRQRMVHVPTQGENIAESRKLNVGKFVFTSATQALKTVITDVYCVKSFDYSLHHWFIWRHLCNEHLDSNMAQH